MKKSKSFKDAVKRILTTEKQVVKKMRDECIYIMQERPKNFWQIS